MAMVEISDDLATKLKRAAGTEDLALAVERTLEGYLLAVMARKAEKLEARLKSLKEGQEEQRGRQRVH